MYRLARDFVLACKRFIKDLEGSIRALVARGSKRREPISNIYSYLNQKDQSKTLHLNRIISGINASIRVFEESRQKRAIATIWVTFWLGTNNMLEAWYHLSIFIRAEERTGAEHPACRRMFETQMPSLEILKRADRREPYDGSDMILIWPGG